MLAAGEDRVEGGLLQGGADRRAHLRSLPDDVEAADSGVAARRRQKRRQHQNRRRFARAVRPEEAVDLAGRDREVDPVNRAGALAKLADEPLHLDCCRGIHGKHCTKWLRFSIFMNIK